MLPVTLKYAAVVISKSKNKRRRENSVQISRNIIMCLEISGSFEKIKGDI